MVAVMVVGVAFAIWLSTQGFGFGEAILIGGVLVALCGLVTGILIAVAEVPPIFATLAMASIVYGGGRVAFNSDVLYAPAGITWLTAIGSGTLLGIPYSILIFAAIAAPVSYTHLDVYKRQPS